MDSNPFDRSLAFAVRWLSDITFSQAKKYPLDGTQWVSRLHRDGGGRCDVAIIAQFCTSAPHGFAILARAPYLPSRE